MKHSRSGQVTLRAFWTVAKAPGGQGKSNGRRICLARAARRCNSGGLGFLEAGAFGNGFADRDLGRGTELFPDSCGYCLGCLAPLRPVSGGTDFRASAVFRELRFRDLATLYSTSQGLRIPDAGCGCICEPVRRNPLAGLSLVSLRQARLRSVRFRAHYRPRASGRRCGGRARTRE